MPSIELPAVCKWESPANPSQSPGHSTPKGSPKQQKWAKQIKASAVLVILAALDDLFYVRREDDLRDVGRVSVLELLDRLGARQWIDWEVQEKGPVDALVIALWRRCRTQALYRRALPEAQAWREGLSGPADPAVPVDAQAAFEQAQRVGYLMVGSLMTSAEGPYTRWCEARSRPILIADTSGRYSWFSGPIESAEHARISLSLLYCRWFFSDVQQAELEASCRVCIPPDDALAAVSCSSDSVLVIVPLGLAVPLAARLHAVLRRDLPLNGE